MANAVIDPHRGSFNKWQMHVLLHDQDLGPCRLPATYPWHLEALDRILQRHQSLYVKPLDAWGGRGVSLVEIRPADPAERRLRWTRDGHTFTFASAPALGAALVQFYPPGAAIVQQAAPLRLIDGRVFDLRVLMQRTPDDRWTEGGRLARIGGEGSVVSNVAASRGSVRDVRDALQAAFPAMRATCPEVRRIQAALSEASEKVCQVLSTKRHFLEVGLDFGVDDGGGIWLIEVNTDDALGGPSHELFAQLPDDAAYQRIEHNRARYDQATLRMVRKALNSDQ